MNKEWENIKELKIHVERLHHLLKDPQPGLFSWHECLSREIDFIAEFSEGI